MINVTIIDNNPNSVIGAMMSPVGFYIWNDSTQQWMVTRAPTATTPDRSQLVEGVDEPTAYTTGVIPGTTLEDVNGNQTISGQSYYVMSPGESLSNKRFNCRVRGAVGASLYNCRILGWPVASPSTSTNYAMLDLTTVGGAATQFYAESIDVTPAEANIGPANTGIRGNGGTIKFCYGSNLPDGIMCYGAGGTLVIRQSLFEKPYSTWPSSDPTRSDGEATHSDCFVQVEGGNFEAYGCKGSAVYYDPLTDLPYNDLGQPEWGGRYLPNTNGAGFSVLLSSGNAQRPGNVYFRNGWMEGAEIPVYIVGTVPSGTIDFSGTRIRRGLLGVPNPTSTRWHIIKAGSGVAVNTTGMVTCTDDRTSWTYDGGSLAISNSG